MSSNADKAFDLLDELIYKINHKINNKPCLRDSIIDDNYFSPKTSNKSLNISEEKETNDFLMKIAKDIQFKECKIKSYNLIDLNKSHLNIIDIGCGNGFDVLSIAKLMITKNAKNNKIIGIDNDKHRIIQCNKLLTKFLSYNNYGSQCKKLNIKIQFYCLDILNDNDVNNLLTKYPNKFNLVRCDRLMENISNIDKCTLNMVRLTKDYGGILSFIETDYRSWNRYTNDINSRNIVNKMNEFSIKNKLIKNPNCIIDINNIINNQLKWEINNIIPCPIVYKNPSKWDKHLKRQTNILQEMISQNYISKTDADSFINTMINEERDKIFLTIGHMLIIYAIKP